MPPACPDISDISFWPDSAPWCEEVRGRQVDKVLTDRLVEPGVNKPIRCGANYKTVSGVHPGVPFQRVDNQPTTVRRVYEANVPPSWSRGLFPTTPVPLPNTEWVRRFGDPTATGTDCTAVFVDGAARKVYEISAFGPSTLDGTGWRSDRVIVWDLNRDWRDQQGGICAAKIPFLPMLPTIEQYERLDIGHALHLVLAGYSNAAPTGFSRGSDGTVPDHPLRNGARLRLTDEAYMRIQPQTRHDRALLFALYTYGVVVTDRTSPTVNHNIRQPMDRRLNVTVTPNLTDFEVLLP